VLPGEDMLSADDSAMAPWIEDDDKNSKVMGERPAQLNTPTAALAFDNQGWRASGAAGKLGEDTSGWLTRQGRELPEEAV
jgi:hypothetical protein